MVEIARLDHDFDAVMEEAAKIGMGILARGGLPKLSEFEETVDLCSGT